MKSGSAPILLATLALLLAIGAWKLSGASGSLRNALPNGVTAPEISVSAPAAVENRLLADQTQLGSDLRGGPGDAAQSSAVRDTERLIRDTSVGAVSRASRADELRQAVAAVRLHACTECLRLLNLAAARP